MAKRKPDLRLSDLEAVIAIDDHDGQVAASKALRTSPGDVSRRAGRVAKYFDRTLFVSARGRSAKLSEAGADLVIRARQALAMIEAAKGGKSSLRVGYTAVARAPVVAAIRRMDSDFSVRLREANGPVFRQLLLRHEIDVAIGYATFGYKEDTEFIQQLLVRQPVDLVVPRDREHLSKRSKKALLDGLRRSYFPPTFLADHHSETGEWLHNQKIDADDEPAGECQTAGEMLAQIGTGRSFGFLPRMCASSAGNDVLFVRLNDLSYKASLFVYYWRETKNEAQKVFLKCLKSACLADLRQ